MVALDRVEERRQAVALAHHYRDEEGLSVAEIARPLGRAEATVRPTSTARRTITKGLQVAPRGNAGFGARRAGYDACAGTRSPRTEQGSTHSAMLGGATPRQIPGGARAYARAPQRVYGWRHLAAAPVWHAQAEGAAARIGVSGVARFGA